MNYNDTHDPNQPLQWWFQESHEGMILFIVFYGLACRWGKCIGCNLYLQESSRPINCLCLMNQIDTVFKNPDVLARRNEIKKVIISNNGSILDEKSFSSTALMYFIALMGRHLPAAKILSIESRPEYVDDAELEFLSRARRDTQLDNIEIAVGVEAFSTYFRNDKLKKGLDIDTFEKFVEKVAPYQFAIKCYFMFKPVRMTDSEAIFDIHQAIDYLSSVIRRYGVVVNLHLNPTYVAKGTWLEKEFREGRYTPPRLKDVARAVLWAEETPLTVFVGLYDEGLAVDGGSFVKPGDEKLVRLLDEFNKTQNYKLLTNGNK
jgi:archaeosine synthase beta-subunit